jgi:hypothetical protein
LGPVTVVPSVKFTKVAPIVFQEGSAVSPPLLQTLFSTVRVKGGRVTQANPSAFEFTCRTRLLFPVMEGISTPSASFSISVPFLSVTSIKIPLENCKYFGDQVPTLKVFVVPLA